MTDSMKKIVTLLLIMFIAFYAKAQTAMVSAPASSQSKTGDVLDLAEVQFDFGKIPQGKPVNHIFEVTNNGTDSLKITTVQASCGCTTPEWDRDQVQAPGQKTKITVGYNAANEGMFTKIITITYNGGKTKQITIKGQVWKTPVTSAPENKELETLKNQ
jgi:hypothetical protein